MEALADKFTTLKASLSFLSDPIFKSLLSLQYNGETTRARSVVTFEQRSKASARTELQRSSTGTVHLHVLGNVITSNPSNVEHILKNNFLNYQKGKQSFSILGDLLGKGIFVADGQQWKFQRKMSSLEVGSLAICLHAMDLVSEEIRSRLMPLLGINQWIKTNK
ncbi:cytochrome P450 family 94 protein, putative [Medicago truncatula]|uniref:Cytochrome P450 family 94 protein, putative n=1 Tax=Medicago truncatula TaxID=3880 RepID=A0A072V9W7_MEDTR|nr:cytochrome P450 family 94 protein, putative [Medicago truncatula]